MGDNISLKEKTIHGLKWSYISTFSTAIMQIGYTAVMARLLNPSDFGLVAMGGVVLRLGQYFAQMGMSSAIIQKKDLTNENISAAFTSSLFLGFIFSLLTVLLAPLAVFIFNNNEIVSIIRLMGLSFLINGFSLTALALIRRNLEFKRLTIAEITAYIIGYLIVGIGLAILGFGVWSLVFASLTQSAILSILTFIIIKHKVTLTFSWAQYKPLFSFGSKVSIISFLEFIGGSLDTILIGRFFGNKKLGFYNRAQMLISLPMTYFISSFSKVLFPSLSAIQDDNERIKKNFFLILKIAATIIFPFAVVVSILSKEIVFTILGAKWGESVTLLRILAIAGAIDYFEHLIAVLFEAKGYLKQKIYLQTGYIITLLIAFYLFFEAGVLGFTIALLISQVIRFTAYSYYLLISFKIKVEEYLRIFLEPFFTTILIASILFVSQYFFRSTNIDLFLKLVINSIIALVSYFAILLLKYNSEIKQNIINILMIVTKRKNESTFSFTRL